MFKTKRLGKNQMDNFESVGRSFLADERADSASYCDDIGGFPTTFSKKKLTYLISIS
jgi:hypothetical protein